MVYSIIGPNLFMNERGVLFEKIAQEYRPIKDKHTEAEDRYVQRHLNRGGQENENQ